MKKTKRITPIPTSGRYDIRHIRKARGQKTLTGKDSSVLLQVKKVKSELDQEIKNLGITEKEIIKWRHGGSVINRKKMSDYDKERLNKQQGLLTARSIFKHHFRDYFD